MKVCICHDVDEKALRITINGAYRDYCDEFLTWNEVVDSIINHVKNDTKASTCCGACTQHIEGMIDNMYEEYKSKGGE